MDGLANRENTDRPTSQRESPRGDVPEKPRIFLRGLCPSQTHRTDIFPFIIRVHHFRLDGRMDRQKDGQRDRQRDRETDGWMDRHT